MANQEKCCNTCGKCIPIGEGEHKNPTLIVLEDYLSAEDFFWCGGRYWEGKQ
ncbi:hypothetical protein H8S37_12550 [Mediterraneibacter sp. NSJ-55]|uniref:Uncharacterized protein n=1 Tax=Mediterraneibacter hominis TaxID=2763054 RepID=A0A923RSX5_9FIRM|nr:hypothetical protein [Mediterraneibacter hominis]MBC5689747.1 hypothetical protein [Mediterraneibacter hominis]